MIKSAAVRLALYYLAIIMALSIGFSILVFHLSDRELSRGLQRPKFINSRVISSPEYEEFRDSRLLEAHNELQAELIIFNLFVLFAGGLISYGLARRSLQPIEEALERQGRFTADASHELRTPLTAMQTGIEVALRNKNLTTTEAKHLLASNLEEVNKLRALSDVLLRLARHDDQALDLRITNVSQITSAAVKSVIKAAKAKHIKITQKAAELPIFGDQAALTEVITILLDNAIKYSPPKSEILVTGSGSRSEALIQVTDQGQGIADSDINHIFERFYRHDASRSNNNTGGYGLGLSIAERLVSLHKGSIAVKSILGSGTTFTVRLPILRP